MICVYEIRNIINNDLYIGSTVRFSDRKWRHFSDLKKGKHHSIILQRAFNKYGESNFIMSSLEECDRNNLISTENKYIKKLEPKYNICRIAGSSLGHKVSDETKKKLSEYAKKHNIRPPKETWLNRMKRVEMIKDGNVVCVFDSLTNACKFIGKANTFVSTISRASKRGIKAYGYNWKIIK